MTESASYKPPFGILYEDNHLLVVVKPPGILAQGDSTNRPNLLDQAKDYIRITYNKPGRAYLGLVHRLDRQVGGVMVFARTSKAAGRLSAQFRQKTTQKLYQAVVHGRFTPPDGELAGFLVRRGRKTVHAAKTGGDAQEAILRYQTLTTGASSSLLDIQLFTGRRHQIRAQLSEAGHPIVGDPLYGSSLASKGDSIGLWAHTIVVTHPTRDEALTFTASPPPDWPWLPLI
jgi:23S rRNA pseudouridine1911/1915/1917 synthase